MNTYWVYIYWVYILASKLYGTLYIGVTNNLLGRVEAHRDGTGSKFTSRYRVHKLVYYEPFDDIAEAIQREPSTVSSSRLSFASTYTPPRLSAEPSARTL